MAQKSLTLRLPLELYERVRANLRKSLNSFMIEAVEEKLAREREEELSRGFESLTGTVEESELSPWLEAQKKAMRQGLD